MPACEHLDYEYFPRFHSDASTTEHTTEWYVSVVHPSHCWLVFDRMTVVMFLFSLSKTSSWQASFSTLQVALHPGLLPSVFGCTGHVFKFAIRPDVAASLTSNVTFAACLDHRCIDASQVKSLPFQHRKSHFIFDFRHRCSDAPDTSASWPYVRTLPLRSAATSPLRRVLIIGASLRPKSSRSRFNTASRTSFRLAAIGVRMHGARLQARRSSGRFRFDQQQHHLCGLFWSSVHPCVPSQVAPVSTPQVSLHSGLLPPVFGCMGHVCKLAVRPDVAASISSNITFAACFDRRCIPSQCAPVSTPQVALRSGLLPSVFGCTGHVCKLAIRPDVAASISSNITFAACFGDLGIRASQVNSVPFQHRKAHFVLDCCHRCSDARGTSASSPFVRAAPLRSAATSPLRRIWIIGASQSKSLWFQHGKSHFIPVCFHRYLDSRGV